ncbi:glycoside hydrolase family 76 protein [Podospora didyma]|uniref:Mannan endo-1,6-alpha-mannosidase n=1 Tax=Podospora didyma TaxID=330526 RepID=A0AAE0TZ76_9PEZI|nr:glycoside hydrolase family 76 protein [Podospora didyma]
MVAPRAVAAAILLLAAGRDARAQPTLSVDLKSPDSIKSAAKIVATKLVSYYHGTEYGKTVGILPGPPSDGLGPYYWWEAGAMWGTLIDYWHYTGDDRYNAITSEALIFQSANSYQHRNWTASLGNDDQAFWGMSAMLAAEVNFPNPPADQPQWLALAQAVFNTQAPRWKTDYCNGGLRWQIPPTNGGYNYKNSIANVCFLNLGARLARYTGNETYSFWAEKTWDWMEGVGYIDEYFNVYDGGNVEKNCSDINFVQFSSNAAVLLHGAAIMYNHTKGSDKWGIRLAGLLGRTLDHFFPNGTMVERACELEKMQCNEDQHSFKGYMLRALATVATVANFTRPVILETLRFNTKAAVQSCLSDGTCGFRWNIGKYDGDTDNGPAGQAMSALAALSTLLIDQQPVKGPLTDSTGGTSVGDPNAGTGPAALEPPRPATPSDRGGASVITALLLASFLCSLVWICSGWTESPGAPATSQPPWI